MRTGPESPGGEQPIAPFEESQHRSIAPGQGVGPSIGPAAGRGQDPIRVTDSLPPLLPVEQAVRLTQLGRATVSEALRRGDLPSTRIGRRVLIPPAALMCRLGLDTLE